MHRLYCNRHMAITVLVVSGSAIEDTEESPMCHHWPFLTPHMVAWPLSTDIPWYRAVAINVHLVRLKNTLVLREFNCDLCSLFEPSTPRDTWRMRYFPCVENLAHVVTVCGVFDPHLEHWPGTFKMVLLDKNEKIIRMSIIACHLKTALSWHPD